MRKHYFGRQLSRDVNERKALFKGLLNSLVLHESIRTTHAKAKSIKGDADKLITKAKVRGEQSRQYIQAIVSQEAVTKLISDLAPRFSNRNGGYTRIIKLGKRLGDNAPMVIIEWVDQPVKAEVVAPKEVIGDNEKEIKEAEVAVEVVKTPKTKKAVVKKIEPTPTKRKTK